jgi:hypothetical protein
VTQPYVLTDDPRDGFLVTCCPLTRLDAFYLDGKRVEPAGTCLPCARVFLEAEHYERHLKLWHQAAGTDEPMSNGQRFPASLRGLATRQRLERERGR